ncbi:helix-turn-helix domain-containing protein [Xylella fastidiosa]|uniref:helix-turn-helix domain-containing protein n=1 Tax=Xylella fastidiosa TaxID=2371 RepID=UPI0000459C56|nr:helix-turn-helix domain-containing protein [Xylella fastidiosa]UIX82148.1 helix-turn-helix domain-containing protein [Xylella fastidiosa subsp. sandyi]
MSTSPIKRAVIVAGGQSALARLLSVGGKSVKQGHIWAWINRGRRVPAEHVLTIEALTGVSRYDLRPDVFGAPPTGHLPEVSDAA